VEADVMALELARRGVPAGVIVRERVSLSTRDNARFSAEVLSRRGIVAAAVVTSDWHLPRAVALFRRAGVLAFGVPAPNLAAVRATTRFYRAGRERFLSLLERVRS
jgi:uncharacterized SAM-binding protein YcdF (DUF218 family)